MADLDLLVTPRAAADRIGPWHDGALRIRVTRPPADGEANRAAIRLVAVALGVAPTRLAFVAGARGRRKRIRVDGLTDAEMRRRLVGRVAD
ncbi:MAG TPA: DUF167 domain-containing protein [Candidatus Angelobacter sp.]|nr:DUF167 domain-containing protein [Candidatus Angelobacter sp.]